MYQWITFKSSGICLPNSSFGTKWLNPMLKSAMKSMFTSVTGFVEGGVGENGGSVFEGGDQRFDIIGFDPLGNEEGERLKVD